MAKRKPPEKHFPDPGPMLPPPPSAGRKESLVKVVCTGKVTESHLRILREVFGDGVRIVEDET